MLQYYYMTNSTKCWRKTVFCCYYKPYWPIRAAHHSSQIDEDIDPQSIHVLDTATNKYLHIAYAALLISEQLQRHLEQFIAADTTGLDPAPASGDRLLVGHVPLGVEAGRSDVGVEVGRPVQFEEGDVVVVRRTAVLGMGYRPSHFEVLGTGVVRVFVDVQVAQTDEFHLAALNLGVDLLICFYN